MESDDRYAVASASGDSGALHLWMRSDGNCRVSQSGCRVQNPACMSRALHRGHFYSAAATASTGGDFGGRSEQRANVSSGSITICAHTLGRSSGGPVARSAPPEPGIASLAISPDGLFLVAGANSGRCYMWSLESGKMIASWDAHFRSVTHVAFTDDSEAVLTGSADASVQAFDIGELVDIENRRSGVVKARVTLHGHSLPVTALSVGFGGASARVLTAAVDRTAKLWHLSSATCIGTIVISSPVVDSVIAPDESAAFLGLESGIIVMVVPTTLSLATTVSDEHLPTFCASTSDGDAIAAVNALALSPLGHELVAGFADGKVRVFDVASRVVLMVYSRHGHSPITWVSTLTFDAVHSYAGDSDRSKTGAIIHGLLYEGALAKTVETSGEGETHSNVIVNGTEPSNPTWSAIDCALRHLAPPNGFVDGTD